MAFECSFSIIIEYFPLGKYHFHHVLLDNYFKRITFSLKINKNYSFCSSLLKQFRKKCKLKCTGVKRLSSKHWMVVQFSANVYVCCRCMRQKARVIYSVFFFFFCWEILCIPSRIWVGRKTNIYFLLKFKFVYFTTQTHVRAESYTHEGVRWTSKKNAQRELKTLYGIFEKEKRKCISQSVNACCFVATFFFPSLRFIVGVPELWCCRKIYL